MYIEQIVKLKLFNSNNSFLYKAINCHKNIINNVGHERFANVGWGFRLNLKSIQNKFLLPFVRLYLVFTFCKIS